MSKTNIVFETNILFVVGKTMIRYVIGQGFVSR